MKKVVFIAICTLGILSLSSCRSYANSCGLADNTNNEQPLKIQQITINTEVTV